MAFRKNIKARNRNRNDRRPERASSSRHELPAVHQPETSWDQAPIQDAAVWQAPLQEDVNPRLLSREELKMREHQYHVERVVDIVGLWIKGTDAAAKGEEFRLEPFLNALEGTPEDDSWGASDDPWGRNIGGDACQWGVRPEVHSGSSHHSLAHTGPLTVSSSDVPVCGSKAYAFVEKIARQEFANDERKRRMHKFYEMPTHEKLKKIGEIVRYLQS